MEPTIKPIETVYNGYRFRSRLEARWAVFFDAAGIRWEYEKEGFQLSDGTCYLPDFWLPDANAWVEIKPEEARAEQLEKVQQFAQAVAQEFQDALTAFQARTPNPIAEEMHNISEELYRLSQRVDKLTDRMMGTDYGENYIPRTVYITGLLEGYGNEFDAMSVDLDGGPELPPEIYVCQGSPYRIGKRYAYTMIELFPSQFPSPYQTHPSNIGLCFGERGDNTIGPIVFNGDDHEYTPRVAAACKAAQQARFEYGEKGQQR